jgi:hypothetical protein
VAQHRYADDEQNSRVDGQVRCFDPEALEVYGALSPKASLSHGG